MNLRVKCALLFSALWAFGLNAQLTADYGCGAGHFYVTSKTPSGGSIGGATSVNWPWTQDIAYTGYNPIGDVAVAYNSNWTWTKIQTGCAGTSGAVGQRNIWADASFHLATRAAVRIADVQQGSTTAAPGSLYEVRITASSGIPTTPDDSGVLSSAWVSKRLNATGKVPDIEMVNGTLQNLPAGSYVITLWVRLIDNNLAPGKTGVPQIAVHNQFLTAQGTPTTWDSKRVVNGRSLTLNNYQWLPLITDAALLSTPVTFTQPVGSNVDLALQGTFKITSGTANDTVTVGFSLDGGSSGLQNQTFRIPANLGVDVALFDFQINVPYQSGVTHNLQMYAKTGSSSVTIQNPILEFVSYPTTTTSGSNPLAAKTSSGVITTFASPHAVDSSSGGLQPKSVTLNPVHEDMSGTVTTTSGSTAVVGSGTSFLSDFVVGDIITINNIQRVIQAITSNTALTTEQTWPAAASGVRAGRQPGIVAGSKITASWQTVQNGPWKKLGEFTIPAQGTTSDHYVWMLEGFVGTSGYGLDNSGGRPYVELAVEMVHSFSDGKFDASNDAAVFPFQVASTTAGLSFFAEMTWGNFGGGNKAIVWMRKITGNQDLPVGTPDTGWVDLNKLYVGVKALPQEGALVIGDGPGV